VGASLCEGRMLSSAGPPGSLGPTVAADTAVHVGGIGAVLEVIPARCRQGGLQFLRPFRVGFGEPVQQYPADPLKTEMSHTPIPIPSSLALALSAHRWGHGR
jgi:hypothetical protein